MIPFREGYSQSQNWDNIPNLPADLQQQIDEKDDPYAPPAGYEKIEQHTKGTADYTGKLREERDFIFYRKSEDTLPKIARVFGMFLLTLTGVVPAVYLIIAGCRGKYTEAKNNYINALAIHQIYKANNPLAPLPPPNTPPPPPPGAARSNPQTTSKYINDNGGRFFFKKEAAFKVFRKKPGPYFYRIKDDSGNSKYYVVKEKDGKLKGIAVHDHNAIRQQIRAAKSSSDAQPELDEKENKETLATGSSQPATPPKRARPVTTGSLVRAAKGQYFNNEDMAFKRAAESSHPCFYEKEGQLYIVHCTPDDGLDLLNDETGVKLEAIPVEKSSEAIEEAIKNLPPRSRK